MRAGALLAAVREDLDTVMSRDPSIRSRTEALLHPGLAAVWAYRIAHPLHRRGHRRTARLLSDVARVLSGSIEIHPGARIGRRFFIDHGAGVVIGETAVIGDDVTLFHQVTLGSVGWWHGTDTAARRHPALGDGVVVGANASILGPVTVGAGTVVGAHALVLRDVPAGARVVAPHHAARTRTGAAGPGYAAGTRTGPVAEPAHAAGPRTGAVAVPHHRTPARDRSEVPATSALFPIW